MDRTELTQALIEINERLEAGWECDIYGAVETAQMKIRALIDAV